MHDPVRHVVVDANVLSAFLCPQSTHNGKVRERSQVLLGAAVTGMWPGLKVYSPAICIAESLCVLDKYHFCKWHGPVKADASKQLATSEYEKARNLLTDTVKRRLIEQLEQEPAHVLLAGLVSPVNTRYQIRRRRSGKRKQASPVKPPMGAVDCVIAGMTIQLVSRLGHESVVLVTADQRLADVVQKAGTLQPDRAALLGLTDLAEQVGMTWSQGLYPAVINIQKASEGDLRQAFGGWPLPTCPLTPKRRVDLTETETRLLLTAWLDVATEQGMSNPDPLPYSDALDDIKTRFAIGSSVLLGNREIFLFLLGKRKANDLPRPGDANPVSGDAPGQKWLFE